MNDPVPAVSRESPHAAPHTVTIFIDTKPVRVPEGRITVARLKELGGVSPADDLNEVLPTGRLKTLADDGVVEVHEGLKFISTPKTGGSSAS